VHCDACLVHAPVRRVIDVASAGPVSSPWSTVATDCGVFEPIRDRFAATAEAASRGLKKAGFATTTPGGRCDACEGLGRIRVSMDFLPDVWMTCESCGGTRYGDAVLACRIDGRHIADVLDMTVDEARAYFGGSPGLTASAQAAAVRRSDSRRRKARPTSDTPPGLKSRPTSSSCSPGASAPGSPKAQGAQKARAGAATELRLAERLAALQQAGLGYVRLGQSVRTLSGGERQRLALASALGGGGREPALYVFDEPTRGLHARDVERLCAVFDGLIAAGHTLVVVEHHLDVIRRADWVIDLGPEGGPAGGRVVAAGPPAVIEACAASHTGRALAAARIRPTSPGACS
jgi:excinuclease ABC subunit A